MSYGGPDFFEMLQENNKIRVGSKVSRDSFPLAGVAAGGGGGGGEGQGDDWLAPRGQAVHLGHLYCLMVFRGAHIETVMYSRFGLEK